MGAPRSRNIRRGAAESQATVNIHEAKTHFSKLLRRVAAGEEIVIARAGTPIARLVPEPAPGAERRLGGWAGRLTWEGDFDTLPERVLDEFEGTER